MNKNNKIFKFVGLLVVLGSFVGVVLWTGVLQGVLLGEKRLEVAERRVTEGGWGALESALEEVLQRGVDEEGRVDYAWISSSGKESLEQVLGGMAVCSPDRCPRLFSAPNAQKAYYLNAYNAFVLYGVAKHWPLKSVQEVPDGGLVTVKPGQGMFYALRFSMGGDWINLYDLEHEIIRAYGDPRIHAAINCASGGCPRLRRTIWRAETLERDLDDAMKEMVHASLHVEVAPGERKVWLSMIFSWFEEDFVSQDQGILEALAEFAEGEHKKALLHAAKEGFSVEYRPYDWSINAR